MKRLGLVVHGGRASAVEAARALAEAAKNEGFEVVAMDAEAALVGAQTVEELPADLDLIVSLGGDGTLLRAFRGTGGSIPILGINYGRLGFLTVAAEHEPKALLEAVQTRLVISERALLAVEHPTGMDLALNDIIVEKPQPGRAVRLDLSVDDEPFIGWNTDGVIVSTPTGSTAYSFSAGGPLVDPSVGCLVITPVSPHGLFDRSIVVEASRKVTLSVDPDGEGALYSIDGGPAAEVQAGSQIEVRTSERKALLATLDGPDFWDRIRDKFGVRG
ncbi:MAG: NAD(+)/NADH kinase [Actinomycetota bacterium]